MQLRVLRFALVLSAIAVRCLTIASSFGQSFDATDADLNAMPHAAEGFAVSEFSKEPIVRNPSAMAFDRRGRLFIGGGPQFRMPTPATPPDEVLLVIDSNQDGVAEASKVLATGFNSIQALAWKGNDLWVANAPDLTVVRDLDGDDVADEYDVIYTGLGTLEHGLHGLNWGPDGKLYMSKGDTTCQPDAPRVFRDLMHVRSNLPDVQTPRNFRRGDTSAVADANLLEGEWFGSADFTRPQGASQLDRLDHAGDWPEQFGSEWSARWHGMLLPPATGAYEFRVESPATVKLRVAGNVVLDTLNPQATATVKLSAGVRVPIEIELATSQPNPRLRVEWRRANQAFEAISIISISSAPSSKPVYRARFETPTDPHTEGGVLRCNADGSGLEVVSRGLRNPWDIAFDDGFDWLATDNDPSGGDKILAPFFGAHFGHHHPWSYNWTDDTHLPTAPASGPFWEGSGTGVVFGNSPQFPQNWRNVWFVGDWLNGTILALRPKWEGTRLVSADGDKPLDVFASRGPDKSLFRVTDIDFGPDGALWVCGWGRGYGAAWDNGKLASEGRVYRIYHVDTPLLKESPRWQDQSLANWSIEELIDGLDSQLPAQRVAAQDELLRRGDLADELTTVLRREDLSQQQQTWILWTLARNPQVVDKQFEQGALEGQGNIRRQSIRILSHRLRNLSSETDGKTQASERPTTEPVHLRFPASLLKLADDADARTRFEIVQAVWQSRDVDGVRQLVERMAVEQDRLVFYALWNAAADLLPLTERNALIQNSRSAVRLGAMLGMLSREELPGHAVKALASQDKDDTVRKWAAHWMTMTGHGIDSAEKVVAQLKSIEGQGPSNEVRVRLIRALMALPPQGEQWDWVYNTLYQRSIDEQYLPDLEQQKVWALRALACDPKALPILWDGLTHAMPAVRTAAVDGFERLGEPSIGYLLDRLEGADAEHRRGAEAALVQLGSRGTNWIATEPRLQRLSEVGNSSENPWVRGAVLALLSNTRETNDAKWKSLAIELATRAANDPHPQVHGRVARLAEKLGKPLTITARHERPSIEAVLQQLHTASAQRGRELFFQSGGLGCAKCHRVVGEGVAFGPDLTNAGRRLAPRFVVESILKPGAVITEGYRTIAISTGEGKVLSGVVTRETASTLELVQSDGQSVLVDTRDIDERHPQSISIMPETFGDQATAQDLADVTAFVLGDTHTRKNAVAEFGIDRGENEITIKLSGQPIATYVFRDEKTLRPYFAHLQTPSGIRVTRNHPPIPGLDVIDHDTMHPGLWLAFGDLNGHDFWRNGARVEHVRFVGEPTASAEGVRFSVENRYIGGDRKTEVCREIARFDIRPSSTGWTLVWESEFHSEKGSFYFGLQDEMGLGLRIASPLRVEGGTGEILNDRGERNEAGTWGRQFRWIDYAGKVGDRTVGVSIVPSPQNARSCWAHSRDYGVVVANPFLRNETANATPLASRTLVKQREKFELAFAVAIHESPPGGAVGHEEIARECLALLTGLAAKKPAE